MAVPIKREKRQKGKITVAGEKGEERVAVPIKRAKREERKITLQRKKREETAIGEKAAVTIKRQRSNAHERTAARDVAWKREGPASCTFPQPHSQAPGRQGEVLVR